jgi:hypothetical protein
MKLRNFLLQTPLFWDYKNAMASCRCGDGDWKRLPCKGLMQKTILRWLGFYPWRCQRCSHHTVRWQRTVGTFK